jgi:hypothetical protein
MNLNEEIAKVAYELFERDGSQHGKDQDHWLEAERIVQKRMAAKKAQVKSTTRKTSQVNSKVVKTTLSIRTKSPGKTTSKGAVPSDKATKAGIPKTK